MEKYKEKKCKLCKKYFINNRNNFFCSIVCSNLFRSKENSFTWKGGLPECIDCKKQLKRYDAKRCKSCSKIGKLNNNFLDNRTSLAILIRNCSKYKKWRLSIYKKDNFKCVICGKKNGQGKTIVLNADHYPKKFSTIIKENNILTLNQALQCNELWDISNGRVLCFECHSLVDDFPLTFKRK